MEEQLRPSVIKLKRTEQGKVAVHRVPSTTCPFFTLNWTLNCWREEIYDPALQLFYTGMFKHQQFNEV
jgi:hypothetical protein